jgi:hypothetical protein
MGLVMGFNPEWVMLLDYPRPPPPEQPQTVAALQKLTRL